MSELADTIAEYETYLKKENLVLARNIQNWRERLIEMLRDAMLEKVRAQMDDGTVERYAAEIAEHNRLYHEQAAPRISDAAVLMAALMRT